MGVGGAFQMDETGVHRTWGSTVNANTEQGPLGPGGRDGTCQNNKVKSY